MKGLQNVCKKNNFVFTHNNKSVSLSFTKEIGSFLFSVSSP